MKNALICLALMGCAPTDGTIEADSKQADDCPGSAQAGALVITEVMTTPEACSTAEWIEVTNTSSHPIDLEGLTVVDDADTKGVLTGHVVDPGAFAVLGRGSAEGWCDPDVAVDAWYGNSPALNNTGDTIAIYDHDRNLIDLTPEIDPDGGSSASLDVRYHNAALNDDVGVWCDASPSPGTTNGKCDIDPPQDPTQPDISCDAMVPGDYQSVPDALQAMDGEYTICLADGADPGETWRVESNNDVTIRPLTANPTVAVNAISLVGLGGSIDVAGITFSEDLHVLPGTSEGHIQLDKCAFDGPVMHSSGVGLVTITNSLFKGTDYGLWIDGTSSYNPSDADFEVFNATFVGNDVAIYKGGWSWGSNLYVYNSLFLNAGTALDLSGATTLGYGYNAFSGNTTNFANAAAPQTGDLRNIDLRVDMSQSPPAPMAGSPLIDAGRDNLEITWDFHGSPRVDAPDIGAVEY